MSAGELPDKEITDRIIGAAIAVHTALGPGYLESFYEEALCIELDFRGIPYERQKPVHVRYRDRPIGDHRLDLLVEQRVIVELKAAHALDPVHFVIMRSYMKALSLQTGLLLNFATMPLTIRRVIQERSAHSEAPSLPEFSSPHPFPSS